MYSTIISDSFEARVFRPEFYHLPGNSPEIADSSLCIEAYGSQNNNFYNNT